MSIEMALQTIIRTPGIMGAAVFDHTGACVLDQLQPPYEPILLAEFLSQLWEVNDNYIVLESGTQTTAICLKFSEGCLLVRMIGNMSLVVIADDSVNLSMVGVALNVAALKVGRSLGIQPPSGNRPPAQAYVPLAHAPQPQPGMGPPPIPGASQHSHSYAGGSDLGISNLGISNLGISGQSAVGHNSTSIGALAEHSGAGLGAGSGMGATDLGNSLGASSIGLSGDWSKKQKSPPGAVGLPVMRHLLKAYLRRLGRDGLAIVDQELMRLGETPATLKAVQFADLINTLAGRIPDTAARSSFVSEALGD